MLENIPNSYVIGIDRDSNVQKYADEIWWDKDTDYFFMAPDHTMISPNTIYGKFRVYLKIIGISHGGKGQGPRLHDLRYPNLNKIQTFCR